MKDIFLPFYLDNEVIFSQELKTLGGCEYVSTNKNETEKTTIKIDNQYPTVLLLGKTGAGKSYLANAMAGQTEPKYGPFSVACETCPECKLIPT